MQNQNAVQPLVSTLADLTAAQLVKFLKDNAPQRPATDVPAFPSGPADTSIYIKMLNYREGVREVYGSESTDPDPIVGDNQKAIDQFAGQAHEWEQHKGTAQIPNWPTLKYVDPIDSTGPGTFNDWWQRYNERYDPASPFFGDDNWTAFLAQNQYFKKTAPPLPMVTVLPPAQAPSTPPVNAQNPVGPKVPGAPWWTNLGGTAFGVGDTDPSGKFRLINPNPVLNDPAKFEWVRA